MADDLYPTPARVLLLQDVRNGAVRDDANCAPHLHHDEGTSRVAEAIWLMRQAGWVVCGDDDVWRLTGLGEDILNGQVPDG